jgi:hypothetical protein
MRYLSADRLDARKLACVCIALVAAFLALTAGTARADNPPPVAGCGNGLSLVYNPSWEAAIAASTHGHVNGDGWVCENSSGFNNSNGHFSAHVVVDNNVPLAA